MWEYWAIAATLGLLLGVSIWRHQSKQSSNSKANSAHLIQTAIDTNLEQSYESAQSQITPDLTAATQSAYHLDEKEMAKSPSPLLNEEGPVLGKGLDKILAPELRETINPTTSSKTAEVIVNKTIKTDVPKIEFQHQYDSAFYDVEKNSFCFPKFPHLDHFMVRIVDKTPYKTIAGLGRKQSQHLYSLSQFESTFTSDVLQLEVEPLSALFTKNPNNILGKNEFLKGNWKVVSDLLCTKSAHRPASFGPLDEKDAQPYVKVHTRLHESLVKAGLVEEYNLNDEAMRKAYINELSMPEIKALCKEAMIPMGKRVKDELVALLQEVSEKLNLPKAAVPCAYFYEFMNFLFDKYIEDMASNLNRFHPMYVGAAWHAANKEALTENLLCLSDKLTALTEE